MLFRNQSIDQADFIYGELLAVLGKFDEVVLYAPEQNLCNCRIMQALLAAGWNSTLLVWRVMEPLKLSKLVNSKLLLVLSCLTDVKLLDKLTQLARSLRFIRETKLLIELVTLQNTHKLASVVLEFCLQQDMLNTALIFGDFPATQTIYGYQAYPSFALLSQRFVSGLASWNLFKDKMRDLRGHRIKTLPDLSEPNTITYRNSSNQTQLLGFVWNMVEEYARKHNAQLQLIEEPDAKRFLSQVQILDLTRDRKMDIAASVQGMSLGHLKRLQQYAYPIVLSSWCTILPMEPLLGISQLYLYLVSLQIWLCLLALYIAYRLLPYMLKQRRHNLYLLGALLMSSLLAYNYYGRLLGLFIAPPDDKHIDSFVELYKSRLHILGVREEYSAYDFDLRTRYATLFRLVDHGSQLMKIRSTFNTSYAYTIAEHKWRLFEAQLAVHRRSLSRPVFRYSRRMCLKSMVPFGLVIAENSPHRAQLDAFMLQLQQSGLLRHWMNRSFYYMVQAGRLKLQDHSVPRLVRPLNSQDLQLVLVGYALGLLISLCVFVFELIIYKIKVWLEY